MPSNTGKPLYPPSPENIPQGLTQVSASFRNRAVLAAAGILLFTILYLGLVVASAWLMWFSIMYDPVYYNKLTILLKLGSIAGSVMLFLFLLKGLFKSVSNNNDDKVELFEHGYPELFAFIRQLTTDTGTPMPKKVFVSPDVNAAVFYNSTFLSLFLPVRKNLLIGMGLVNSVNLIEFKAILAHEFGHFSQRSMKIGSYLYVANRIIIDLVYSRDKWDRYLYQWRAMDIRISFMAWALIPVVEGIRALLKGLHQVLMLNHASLSREMEFHADRVAVSVAGSRPIVNGLARTDNGFLAWQSTAQALSHAAEQNLYTNDFFLHQARILTQLTPSAVTYTEGEYLFKEDDQLVANMYASHPSNYDRERNATQMWVATQEDDRSPWLLFGQADDLRKLVTGIVYRNTLGLNPHEKNMSADKVQAFIEAEAKETALKERFEGVYADRLLSELDLENPDHYAKAHSGLKDALKTTYLSLFGEGLKARMAERARHMKELGQLAELLNTASKQTSFTMNGQSYRVIDASDMYKERLEKLNAENAWFEDFDKQVFGLFWNMTADVPVQRSSLLEKYKSALSIQDLFKMIGGIQNSFVETVNELQTHTEIDNDLVTHYSEIFKQHYDHTKEALKISKNVPMPAFENMKGYDTVYDYLCQDNTLISGVNMVSDQWINGFYGFVQNMRMRLVRLHDKAVGQLLTLKEEIAAAYLEG